jgi:hypothetical protein
MITIASSLTAGSQSVFTFASEKQCPIQALSISKSRDFSFNELFKIISWISDHLEEESNAEYLLRNSEFLQSILLDEFSLIHLSESHQKRIRTEIVWNLCQAINFCTIPVEQIRSIIDDQMFTVLEESLSLRNFPSASLVSTVNQAIEKLSNL